MLIGEACCRSLQVGADSFRFVYTGTKWCGMVQIVTNGCILVQNTACFAAGWCRLLVWRGMVQVSATLKGDGS